MVYFHSVFKGNKVMRIRNGRLFQVYCGFYVKERKRKREREREREREGEREKEIFMADFLTNAKRVRESS